VTKKGGAGTRIKNNKALKKKATFLGLEKVANGTGEFYGGERHKGETDTQRFMGLE